MSEKTHEVSLAAIPAPVSQALHPMVAAALRNNPDPAVLREFLDIQREWEAGEARRAYTAALVELKRDLPTVLARDSVVDYTGTKGRTHYRHTSLAAAMDAITEPLTQHGFSVAWVPSTPSAGAVSVICRLSHHRGHVEETSMSAPPDTSGSKGPAQAIASPVTLLQRYTLLALLGIATKDHVEGGGADAIDATKSLAAVSTLRQVGITLEQAEDHVQKPISGWTASDLSKLRTLFKDRRDNPQAPAPVTATFADEG